jgi:predicted house-cleaning noncanonical NTP pyrophosphatase (MazG superfamily)
VTTYNKLVRDKIPDELTAKGLPHVIRTLDDDAEYTRALADKLVEEATEFRDAIATNGPRTSAVEELGDVLDVAYALVRMLTTITQISAIRELKDDARGGFRRRIFLESVEDLDPRSDEAYRRAREMSAYIR